MPSLHNLLTIPEPPGTFSKITSLEPLKWLGPRVLANASKFHQKASHQPQGHQKRHGGTGSGFLVGMQASKKRSTKKVAGEHPGVASNCRFQTSGAWPRAKRLAHQVTRFLELVEPSAFGKELRFGISPGYESCQFKAFKSPCSLPLSLLPIKQEHNKPTCILIINRLDFIIKKTWCVHAIRTRRMEKSPCNTSNAAPHDIVPLSVNLPPFHALPV